MTNYEVWQGVLAEFELKLSKANFHTWFLNTGISEYDDGKIIVCVPTQFIKTWLEKKYNSEIVKTIEKVTKKPVKRIEYKVENIKNIQEKECELDKKQISVEEKPSFIPPAQKFNAFSKYGLNPNYTFDTFIVGKGNELAHAAAQAVANRPGEAYNPLFIYGDVGLGKTHLIQAIAHKMLSVDPGTKILYVSSEKFTNEFVAAIKEGRGKEFKQRYRKLDLLLIDDIQFIAGKEQTQEEFFHTFNELHQNGKQVVLTSDRPPKAIPSLEDRLRSRFEWGMIADVMAPDMETRVAILQSKAQEKKFPIDQHLLSLIAEHFQSNIRELEGALNKIIAYHELKNIPPSTESISAILSTFASEHSRGSATPRQVIEAVTNFFDIDIHDVLGKSREKRLAFPRQIIMYLLRTELDMSYPAIGEELGGRDHTTAMHAANKIEEKKQKDTKLKQDIETIKKNIFSIR